MNFLKHVMQQLDDQSLGLLGAVLGENESKVRDGVKSAVPKILDAMVSAAKDEQGRDMLWRELRDTDTTVASSFSKQMYYKDSQALVANGHDQLNGLTGADTNRLIQSVSRESDIGSTSARRLVGAVTPLVFASVANHQQSKRLNQSELGRVIAQQKSHLSDWERQSDLYFANAANNEDDNEPLFSSLPKAGGAAVTATAVGSATLGMHHFHNRDNDKKDKEDSASTVGATSLRPKENDSAYDRRSADRRQRDAIAAHPANSGFAANTPKGTDQLSSSVVVAGPVAAAGAGAAAVVATAISPAAKAKAEAEADAKNKIAGQTDHRTTTTDSASTTHRQHSETTNTYDSKNPVSGFAAANPGTAGTSGEVKTSDHDAGFDADGKRLWTPDSADGQRAADGTLRYSDRDTTSNNSGGWFHWLWWPVLFFGSLLALALMFLNPGDSNSQPADQDQTQSVAAVTEGESSPSDSADVAAVTEGDEDSIDSESTSDESNSDILNSSIQITPNESDVTTEASNALHESSTESEAASSSDQGSEDSASKTLDSDGTTPNATGETTEGSNASIQDDMPSLEGSIEASGADEADGAKDEADSDGNNDNSETEGVITPELNTTDLEIDADEQVEELLSAIETELESVKNEAQAKAAEESLSAHISSLEKVLANRAQWEDEIEILVDFQLEDGQKMLAQAKKNAFQSEAVKKTLKGKFKELNKLMKTANDSP